MDIVNAHTYIRMIYDSVLILINRIIVLGQDSRANEGNNIHLLVHNIRNNT